MSDKSTNPMLLASQLARTLNNTFWANAEQGVIYGIYLWDMYAVPNTVIPYQLNIKVFAPSSGYYADSRQYRGGITLDGAILMSNSTDGYQGRMVNGINGDTMIWTDGSLWKRVNIKPDNTIDQYSAEGALEDAKIASAWYNKTYNATYPANIGYLPWGTGLQ